MTFCKPFTRSYLDYGDVDYDRASNESFHQSFESLKHSSAIAMTGAIRGTLSKKLFQELGLELIKSRRSLRNLCLLFKLIKKSPASLFQLIPDHNTTRRVQKSQFPFSNTKKQNFFKKSFFPAVIIESNKIGINIRNSSSCNVFILKLIKPEPNQVFNVDSSSGLKQFMN